MSPGATDDLGIDLAEVATWFAHDHETPYVLARISEETSRQLGRELAMAVRRCYVADDSLQSRANATGCPITELIAARLPDPGSTMSGDFGEILVYVYLAARQLPERAIGPLKWRLKQDRTKPAPGSDVIHFVLPSWPAASAADVLMCAEVKTKATGGRTSPITAAIDDSVKDRTSRLSRTLVWLRERALLEPVAGADIAVLERFIHASDHPAARREFRAVAVICDSLVGAELASLPAAFPAESKVVVLVVPALQSTYTAVFTAAASAVPPPDPPAGAAAP